LEGEVSELYSAYVAELGAAFDQVEPWWEQLRGRHSRKQLRLRWPAGPAAHPRVLAVYREFHDRLTRLRPRLPPGPAPRFDDDEAWGDEAEGEPTLIIPPDPRRLLVDRLQVEAEDLHAKMVYLLMPPVGAPPEPRPTIRGLEVVEPDAQRARAFRVRHRHGPVRGTQRLICAGFDLRERKYAKLGPHDAGEIHRLAHGSYLRALEQALAEAERWWARELGQREVRGLDADQALDDAYAAHPVGPAGHPRVVGVVQAYWALCHEINAVLTDEQQHVAPEQLLLGWLLDGTRDSWVEILSAMPYWPVGLDAEGAWV
jgi:hypothetical protein